MKWASAVAEGLDLFTALDLCADRVLQGLENDTPPNLVVVFVSTAYGPSAGQVPGALATRFRRSLVFGCSAGGLIGAGQEVEGQPAVALTVAHLPDVGITPFRVTAKTSPTPDDPPDAWARLVGVTPEMRPGFLILMDPFSPPGEQFPAGLDFAFPAAPKAGGLASGGRRPGAHHLFLGNQSYQDGAIGLSLTGDIAMDTVVAQGCRPIGEPKRITACQDNLLLALEGKPPLTYLREVYAGLPARDQGLVATNLFLGIAMDPLVSQDKLDAGSFLIRNLLGADMEQDTIAVGEHLREGQVVQFHVRDALSSAEDLHRQLLSYTDKGTHQTAAGALLFQCNGRGMHLYGRPNHDSDTFRNVVGSVPLGGFFCSGEFGQVAGTTYLHGYTSSFAIFRRRP